MRGQVVCRLEVEPEFRGRSECLSKQPRGIGRNASFAPHDFVDSLHGNAYMPGQCFLGLAHWLKKLLEQDDPRMCSRSVLGIMANL